MIDVSVLYPLQEGSHFDMEYYRHSHRPLVKEKLGAALKGFSIEQGISGATPDDKPRYTVVAHLLFDSREAFTASFQPHQDEIIKDVANFTDIEPVFQISNVIVPLEDQDYSRR